MRVLILAILLVVPALASAQSDLYSRRNTFTVFGEFSNDSSHIILGATPNRKLAGAGVQYERRLLSPPHYSLTYMVEFRPFILSSDPLANVQGLTSYSSGISFPFSYSGVVFQCLAGTRNFSGRTEMGSYTETLTTTCSRQHTYAQGGSPIGLRLHFRTGHPLQVTLSSNGGYMFSTKPLPIPSAGNFNFTFNFGGGLEYFLSPRRSVRLEYLVQHYSNHSTATDNPGVDSGFVRLAYAFGH